MVSAVVSNCTAVSRSSEPNLASDEAPRDQDIVAGIAAGQPWAADVLYDRVHSVVDRSLRRILRSTGPDYDDLVQAAFERIITVLSSKPLGGKCDLRAWSAAVATHVALDSLRRRGRERKLFSVFGAAEPDGRSVPGSPENRIEARSEVLRVQGILTRMNPKSAQTLLLHDVLGYDLAEIAQITGATVAAAQARLVRSRKELLRRANKKGAP